MLSRLDGRRPASGWSTNRIPHGQGGTLIVLASIVTAPAVRASALPFSVAPVFIVMAACAIRFPTMVVPVPRVAALPIAQNTFPGLPGGSTLTMPAAVVSVDDIWKIQTAFGSPTGSSVRFPVIPSEGWAMVVYTPGGRVEFPMSGARLVPGGSVEAVVYAVVS